MQCLFFVTKCLVHFIGLSIMKCWQLNNLLYISTVTLFKITEVFCKPEVQKLLSC